MSPIDDDDALTLTAIHPGAVRVPPIVLHVEPRAQQPFEVPLGVSALVVGNHGDCHVTLEDPHVSRRHCELSFGERGVVVRDLDSKNGTFIAGIPVREAVLPLGVPLVIGETRLSLHLRGEPTTVALSKAVRFGETLGASLVMRALFARLEQAALSDETVLLFGESGTGKELLARGVHAHSPRREGPFVVVDCGAVVSTLIESELFGHRRGAFTGAADDRRGAFERAQGGTLFLDELGELPLDLQPKLLRAIETRTVQPLGADRPVEFDARIVAATHRDLKAMVSEGSFRQDLYYRLAVLEFEAPPLRQRKDDIPLLVERFLSQMKPPRRLADLPPSVHAMLRAHTFPGNVRELRNVVARLAIFPDDPGQAFGRHGAGRTASNVSLPWREARAAAIEDFERRYLEARLAEHLGNVSKTAEAIGVTRQFLHRLLDKHAIEAR